MNHIDTNFNRFTDDSPMEVCMVCCNVHTAQSHLDHDCQEHQGPVNDLIYSPFSSSPRHGLDRGQGGTGPGQNIRHFPYPT